MRSDSLSQHSFVRKMAECLNPKTITIAVGLSAFFPMPSSATAKDGLRHLPDLAVTRVSRTPATARVGSRVKLIVKVANKGAANAPAGRLGIYLQESKGKNRGRRLKRANVMALGSGRSLKITIRLHLPAGVPLGAYRLLACADDAHDLREAEERDNCRASRPLRLTAAEQTTPTSPTVAHDPILFVHGWADNALEWYAMVERFEDDGWPRPYLSAYTYSASQSNKIDAEVDVRRHVEALLRATGAKQVDIVSHSMGALNTRWYIKELGGEAMIDDWVSLAGPNHGTTVAEFCAETPCEEMRPGSTFLSELNAGDETPGAVDYGTWWSPCDDVVTPTSSVRLEGAANHETACISHRALLTDKYVYEQVRNFVK